MNCVSARSSINDNVSPQCSFSLSLISACRREFCQNGKKHHGTSPLKIRQYDGSDKNTVRK